MWAIIWSTDWISWQSVTCESKSLAASSPVSPIFSEKRGSLVFKITYVTSPVELWKTVLATRFLAILPDLSYGLNPLCRSWHSFCWHERRIWFRSYITRTYDCGLFCFLPQWPSESAQKTFSLSRTRSGDIHLCWCFGKQRMEMFPFIRERRQKVDVYHTFSQRWGGQWWIVFVMQGSITSPMWTYSTLL